MTKIFFDDDTFVYGKKEILMHEMQNVSNHFFKHLKDYQKEELGWSETK